MLCIASNRSRPSLCGQQKRSSDEYTVCALFCCLIQVQFAAATWSFHAAYVVTLMLSACELLSAVKKALLCDPCCVACTLYTPPQATRVKYFTLSLLRNTVADDAWPEQCERQLCSDRPNCLEPLAEAAVHSNKLSTLTTGSVAKMLDGVQNMQNRRLNAFTRHVPCPGSPTSFDSHPIMAK